MDPMDKKINELLKVTEENNIMLRKMKRSMRIATIMRVVYWVIVIGVAVGAYYFIQPYIEQAQDVYQDVNNRFEQVDAEFQGNLDSFLDFFRGGDSTE